MVTKQAGCAGMSFGSFSNQMNISCNSEVVLNKKGELIFCGRGMGGCGSTVTTYPYSMENCPQKLCPQFVCGFFPVELPYPLSLRTLPSPNAVYARTIYSIDSLPFAD